MNPPENIHAPPKSNPAGGHKDIYVAMDTALLFSILISHQQTVSIFSSLQ